MVIGVIQFELLVPGAESLKDKRAVVRSVCDKLYRELQVSIAEVGGHDNHQVALMGAAVVATDGPRAHGLLDKMWNRLTDLRDGQIGSVRRQIIMPSREDEAPELEPNAQALGREMLERFNAQDGGTP